MFDDEKPYDGRLSRTVLRELQPEMPVSTRLYLGLVNMFTCLVSIEFSLLRMMLFSIL